MYSCVKVRFMTVMSLILLVVLSVQSHGQGTPQYSIIRASAEGVIDGKGDLKMSITWKFPTSADYIRLKAIHPNPHVIMRDVFSGRSSFVIENPIASYNDAANTVIMSGVFKGTAMLRRRLWEADLGKGMDVAWQEGRRIVLINVEPIGGSLLLNKYNIQLPQEAVNIRYSAESGLITYSMPVPQAAGMPILDLDLMAKPRLMSSAYKAYGNRELDNGAMWVAKTVFRNVGASNIRELQVSYKLGEYCDWSEPTFYGAIVPGGTVVDLYYPVLSSKVTDLRSPTPVDVQVRFTYKDESGRSYMEHESKRISIMGINQFEFSNVLPEESTGTWMDKFSNAGMLAAFCTRLDDPVKSFAGMTSQLAGGAGAAIDDESAVAFAKALFDLMVANGISYQTPSGFLVDYSPGQDIKYPRDVLRDKAGTCVDLAILYASVCEAVGLRSYILLIPGHAYPILVLPSGQILPVETTVVRGAAMGRGGTFEEAVKIARKSLPDDLDRPHYLIDLQERWRAGVSNPELPRLDADVLHRWGYRLPDSRPPQTPTRASVEQPVYTVSATADLTGTYRGKLITGDALPVQLDITVVLRQSGAGIQGELRFEPPAQGTGQIQGQVHGNQVAFTLNYGGTPYQFQCTVQGSVLKGGYRSNETNETGDIYLERVGQTQAPQVQSAQATLAGTYRGRLTMTQPERSQANVTLVIRQQGAALEGELRFDPPFQGSGSIKGQVQDNKVTLVVIVEGLPYHFHLTASGNSLRGTFNSQFTMEAGEIQVEKSGN